MEPINSNACNNSEIQQQIENLIDKILPEFNQFREKVLHSNPNTDMNFDQLVDLFITHGRNCNTTTYYTQDQVSTILQDFSKFESTLPPQTNGARSLRSVDDFNTEKEDEETEMMIKELAEDTSQNVGLDTRPEVVHSHIGVDSTNKGVFYIRHGEMNCYGSAGEGGAILSSIMRSFQTGPGMFASENANKSIPRSKIKRKYRGVVETEEETFHRMERNKVKSREAATKAQANKKARELYLQNQLSKLHHKNEFLKRQVMFWKGHKKANLQPLPLRRTVSGP